MTEWTFNFYQMLLMLFVSYYIGGIVADVKTVMEHRKMTAKVVPIDISRVDGIWYAFESESKNFLVQSSTYDELQKKLTELGSGSSTFITNENKLKALLEESKNASVKV